MPRRLEWILLSAILALAFHLRSVEIEAVYLNIHAERDLWRSLEMLRGEAFHHTGAELTLGGRTPGNLLYLLNAIPLLITTHPGGLLVWLALLHTATVALLWHTGRQHYGSGVGLLSAGIMATWPLAVLHLRYLWNPAYIAPLVAVFLWAMLRWASTRQARRAPVALGALLAMLQVHVSALFLVLALAVLWVLMRLPFDAQAARRTALVAAVLLAPYLAGEIATGADNTRALLFQQPRTLTTVNDAEIEIGRWIETRFNLGSLKALQVVLSPVFYDQRTETGSFSYLHWMAESLPALGLPLWVQRGLMLVHHLRWAYVAAVMGALGWLTWRAWRGRSTWRDNNTQPESRVALVLSMLMAAPILGNVILAVMVTPVAGGVVGVGVPRYFFVLMPTMFLVMAVGISRIITAVPWTRHGVVAALAALLLLQAAVARASIWAATSTGRAFRYSLHQSFTYAAQREAADVLMDWQISVEEFTTSLDALDHLFDNTTYSVSNLEQSLDWAYMHHQGHRATTRDASLSPARAVILADLRRTPAPQTQLDAHGWRIVAKRRVGGPWTGPRAGQPGDLLLILVEGDQLPEHRYSPVRNMWVKMTPAR